MLELLLFHCKLTADCIAMLPAVPLCVVEYLGYTKYRYILHTSKKIVEGGGAGMAPAAPSVPPLSTEVTKSR
jgi:hypothetical protein